MKLKLTTVICTCNGEEYIEEQLKSIINQSVKVHEIILCDDNSTDKTILLAEKYLKNYENEIEINIRKNPEALGVANNFWQGIKQATGDYIFTSDQDDIWLNNKVEIFVSEFKKSNKLLYFSNGLVVDQYCKHLNYTLWDSINFKEKEFQKNEIIEIMLNKCIVTGAAMAVSREIIDKIDYIPEQWLHDGWLGMVAALDNSIVRINQSTFLYRQHSKNVIGAGNKSIIKKIEKWYRNIENLESIRANKLLRYKGVLLIENEAYKSEINRCIKFWEEINLISKKNRLYSIKIILGNLFKGNYKLYSIGIVGAVRDIISCVI